MYIVIFVTASNKKEAERIAQELIRKKLAACVNIIDKIESIFRWQGKIETAKEALLVIKSKKVKLPKIIKLIRLVHSYQVPEIIALPIIDGDKPYLRWIDECIGRSG
jgi:periplasmic divalent cation tolerance protein